MAQPKHACKTCKWCKYDESDTVFSLDECTYPDYEKKVNIAYPYWFCRVARKSENLCNGKMWIRKPGIGRKSTKVSKRKAA